MLSSNALKDCMGEAGEIAVEVVYAVPGACSSILVRLPAGASVADVIALSGIVSVHPEIDPASNPVGIFGIFGIFGIRVNLTTQPAAGDRIEIYRSLIADPKQSRRARGANKQAAKKTSR